MKINLLGRTIEVANRVNVDNFNKEKVLIGVSFRKSDLKEWKSIKTFLLYCFMPYSWLDRQFCKNKL